MSAIGDFVNAIQRIATAAGLLPGRKIVRVLEPLSAVDNPDTGTTDLSVTAGAGGNAYSTTTASFVQPAKGDNVQISVDSTGWFVPFPAVFMDGVGLYTIVSKDSPTLATLQLQFDIAESGSTVTAGKLVVPTGFPGNDGASAYGSTDSFFTQPAVGSTVTIRTHNSPWAAIGQVVFLSGSTPGGYYKVTAKGSEPGGEPTLDLINLGYPGNAAPGDNVTYSQTISPAGLQGPGSSSGYVTGALPADDADAVVLAWINDTGVDRVLSHLFLASVSDVVKSDTDYWSVGWSTIVDPGVSLTPSPVQYATTQLGGSALAAYTNTSFGGAELTVLAGYSLYVFKTKTGSPTAWGGTLQGR